MRRLLLVLALFVLAAPAVAGGSGDARGGQAVPVERVMLGASSEPAETVRCSLVSLPESPARLASSR